MKRYDNDLLDPSLRPAILVSGGPQPEPALLVRLREKLPQAPLLCADRGADLCRAAGVVPDGLIGDMDSLSAATRDWLEETGVPEVVYPSEKDDSDQALATEKLFADGAEEIVVIGGLGGRMDHELANMMELVRAGREGRSIVYWDDTNRLRYIGPGRHEIARTDDYIGIVPFSDDGMVLSNGGLYYRRTFQRALWHHQAHQQHHGRRRRQGDARPSHQGDGVLIFCHDRARQEAQD